MKKTVALLYPFIPEDAAGDDRDTLVQRDEIAGSLGRIGYESLPLAMTLDLGKTLRELQAAGPWMVFNLVESLEGHDRLLHLAPALLESANIPFTGSPWRAIARTTDKMSAKGEMRRAGLPTPAFAAFGEPAPESGLYLVKSNWEHGSAGIDECSVIPIESGATNWHENFSGRFGSECFAEKYIDGREFNISLICGPSGPEVLPPAEIRFVGYHAGKPKIVDYRAKWDQDAPEYRNTARSFDFPPGDGPLLETLRDLSLRCWREFGLRGYARVDFRVDDNGTPWILEINANPCLSSDAGFIAAAARAGIDYDRVIRRIVECR